MPPSFPPLLLVVRYVFSGAKLPKCVLNECFQSCSAGQQLNI